MCRHDQGWLLKWRNSNKKRLKWDPVDWSDRDKKWSLLLKTAALRLKTARPAKRASKQAIAVKAGLPKGISSYGAKGKYLSLCKEILFEEAETTAQWKERKSNIKSTKS